MIAATQLQGRDYLKQIKRLKSDLARKEKALAEAAAFVGRGRGTMTSLVERQRIIGNIVDACDNGASLQRSCRIVGISLNGGYRWQRDNIVVPDLCPEALRPIGESLRLVNHAGVYDDVLDLGIRLGVMIVPGKDEGSLPVDLPLQERCEQVWQTLGEQAAFAYS
jgi:hypothetical protein